MIALLVSLAARVGVPAPLRKAAGIAFAVVTLIALLSLGKCVYDRKLIAKHEAEAQADIAKKTRPADERAAATRLSDMKRNMEHEAAERAAVAALPDEKPDAFDRARMCVRLCRQAPDSAPAACRPCG